MANRKGGLGRGFDALFADAEPIEKKASTASAELAAEEAGSKGKAPASEADRVIYININDIKPNADQPRKRFDEDKLKELSESIKVNGVIQPLIVRKAEKGYELVAGERRWRASRLAGLKEIPCIIREFTDEQNMVVAIIENMQREDLDAIEEANGLRQMIKQFGFTQEQVSKSLGKSRAYIANSMRLLKLPEEIQDMIVSGKLSAAHGRTLVGIADDAARKKLAEKIVKEGLSVRATERLAGNARNDAGAEKKRKKPDKSTEVRAVEDELRRIIGTKVNIVERGQGHQGSGKLEIEYYSLEELNRIIDMLRELD